MLPLKTAVMRPQVKECWQASKGKEWILPERLWKNQKLEEARNGFSGGECSPTAKLILAHQYWFQAFGHSIMKKYDPVVLIHLVCA